MHQNGFVGMEEYHFEGSHVFYTENFITGIGVRRIDEERMHLYRKRIKRAIRSRKPKRQSKPKKQADPVKAEP